MTIIKTNFDYRLAIEALNGIRLFADGTGNMYLRGSIYVKNGYFQGTVYATDGEFTGKVTATSGEFKGNVYASDLFLGGKSILNSLKTQITGDYLNLNGLTVNNGGVNTMTVNNGIIQFGTGAQSITINNGGVSLGNGVKLNWDNVQDAPNFALKSDIPDFNLPNYIKSTYISSTTIKSPTIEGAQIFGGILGYDKNRYLTMDVSGGYLTIYDKAEFGASPALELVTSANPGQQAVKFRTAKQDWLGYNYTQKKTYPIGTWNFGNATIEGLTATFG